MKNVLFTISTILILSTLLIAQDGGRNYVPDYSAGPEANFPHQKSVDLSGHFQLEEQLKSAIESGNTAAEKLVREKLNQLNESNIVIPYNEDRDYPLLDDHTSTDELDWLNSDVMIYSGFIGHLDSDHKRIDLKMGEDGNLYAALIRRPDSTYNGRITVYRSTNGGLTWLSVQGIVSATAYFGQVSITVEARNNVNLDSTRVFVFYSRSTNSNFDDATINFASFRRDGSAYIGGTSVLTPSTGNKLLYPSAVSDGQYWSSGTYIGVTCGEYSNNSTQGINLHFARTTNWGESFTTATINDGYPTWGDWFPVASFKRGTTLATDSVFIAVERRFSDITSKIRVLSTSWIPSSSFYRYSITGTGTDEYKKPDITIVQDAPALDKRVVIACTKNGQAVYHYSNNGGGNWNLDANLSLASESNISYVSISSDSSTAGDDYVIAAFQKGNGDSLVVRRGRPGSLGTRLEKPNQFRSSPFNAPSVAIYNDAGNKHSAFAYTGLGSGNYTSNLYFNQENLTTSITQTGNNLVSEYSLEQNYPNPFNPATTIKFSIPVQDFVTLRVFNSIGQEVSLLFSGFLPAGSHQLNFDATNLTSGIYFYQIKTQSFTSTKKMMLLK